ncbi:MULTISPECIES: GNAT family N-acetyltransferase [Fervidobacterium]|uniref:GCN5-related N-acetyltransferase n=1 Tax=Fervidobacterium nodosum (strain ATCC 35602 / DSM 5306 / Rt17-B1) TaxID=381764 RepID=A7HLL3_FERNB|nr:MULTISPECIES: GNAT family protein [Fervidobacterium]ABS60796.1 GCN5-related N-acetyltransferase [Fervidobacterium nodosum Rt17-B1]KAF2962002.1 GCN5 family acetyltransferase [Fervidobacterium sp. 2310opik-2]PHJ14338.1 GCN5 family acetyltransferase [Fervidobacterium sp. SC_NGM5_G05]HOJ94956.1 GNAT family protein [Fervidobacterium nodosum]
MDDLRFIISDRFQFELSQDDLPFFSERRMIKANPVLLVFKINDRNEEIGFVEFDVRVVNKNAYMTYFLKKQYRGKGLGREMVKKAIDFAFNELNLNRITAEVYEYNTASIKILESLGFIQEGRLRKAKFHNSRFWDIIVYGLLREDI